MDVVTHYAQLPTAPATAKEPNGFLNFPIHSSSISSLPYVQWVQMDPENQLQLPSPGSCFPTLSQFSTNGWSSPFVLPYVAERCYCLVQQVEEKKGVSGVPIRYFYAIEHITTV